MTPSSLPSRTDPFSEIEKVQLQPDKPISVPELRRAAYSVVAKAMNGEKPSRPGVLAYAVDIVLADERKGRTRAQRMLQFMIITELSTQRFMRAREASDA